MEYDENGVITEIELELSILFRTFCKTGLSHVNGWHTEFFVNNRLRY